MDSGDVEIRVGVPGDKYLVDYRPPDDTTSKAERAGVRKLGIASIAIRRQQLFGEQSFYAYCSLLCSLEVVHCSPTRFFPWPRGSG